MNDEMVVIKRGTAKFQIRKKEYEALKELKKTNPLILNIDHVLSFARVREGRVWRLNLSHTPGLQEYIGVLKHLTGLEELEIWRTDVSDLSPLRHLKKLKKLTLGSGVRGNISPLYGLRELLDLYLHADVKDLTPLKGLSKLEKLYLHCPAEDFSPLENLHNLRELTIYFTRKDQDLGFFRGLKNLQRLHTHGNISNANLEPIKYLKSLEYMYLGGPKTLDVKPVGHLKNLQELEILDAETLDLSPLGNLKKLKRLHIWCKEASGLSSLRGAEDLERLDLGVKSLSEGDLTVLSGMKDLSIHLNGREYFTVEDGVYRLAESPLSEPERISLDSANG